VRGLKKNVPREKIRRFRTRKKGKKTGVPSANETKTKGGNGQTISEGKVTETEKGTRDPPPEFFCGQRKLQEDGSKTRVEGSTSGQWLLSPTTVKKNGGGKKGA